jgi:hypothetical protein
MDANKMETRDMGCSGMRENVQIGDAYLHVLWQDAGLTAQTAPCLFFAPSVATWMASRALW